MSNDLCVSNLVRATQSCCGLTLGMSVGLHSCHEVMGYFPSPWLQPPLNFHMWTLRTNSHYNVPFLQIFTQDRNILSTYAPCWLDLMDNNPIQIDGSGTQTLTQGSCVNGDIQSKYRTALFSTILASGQIWLTFFNYVPNNFSMALGQCTPPTKHRVNNRYIFNRLHLFKGHCKGHLETM